MRKTSKIILVTVIATSILLGLGYAAIQNITLNILGTATAQTSQDNFKVRFTRVTDVSDAVNVTASVNTDTTASINVTGLTEKGQSVTATYEIENQSSDLSSDLKIETINNNTEYFRISSRLAENSLTSGEKTTVTVTIEMLKTPIDENVSADVGVELTAMPVEPGKEGTSEGTNDFSQTPDLTNEYGFYFWEGYSIQGVDAKYTFVFFEEGNGALFVDDVLYEVIPYGSFAYDTLAVDIDGMGEFKNFSLDGKQLFLDEADGAIAYLDEEFGNKYEAIYPEINEYGFYYGRLYSLRMNDVVGSVVFFEDNAIGVYENGILTRLITENVIYSENKIECDEMTMNIYFEGLLASVDGQQFCIDVTYADTYDAMRKEKNEYGFYYDYAYSMNSGEAIFSLTFDENKAMGIYVNGVLLNYIDEDVYYSKNKIEADGSEIVFSDNGQTVTFSGMNFALDIPQMQRLIELEEEKNEYGFYFGTAYSAIINDDSVTIIFNEDGSAVTYVNGTLDESVEAGTFKYSLDTIIDEVNDIAGQVINDGDVIIMGDQGFVIDLYFNDRYQVEE